MSTQTHIERIAGMCLLIAAVSLLVAIAINLLLFRFGPWADVWIEHTWIGVGLIGGLGAFLTRRRWLDGDRSGSS